MLTNEENRLLTETNRGTPGGELDPAARNRLSEATSPPTTPKPENARGAFIPFPSSPQNPTNNPSSKWRPRRGPANGTNGAEAALRGTPWLTIRQPISSMSARATAGRGTRIFAALRVATTFSSPRSLRSTRYGTGTGRMKAIVRRVGRLEDRFQTQLSGKPNSSLRIIVTRAGSEPANLVTSTCTRYVRDGLLTEVVHLDGARGLIGNEELETFVARFPRSNPDGRGER
jgi:hypothetical protein